MFSVLCEMNGRVSKGSSGNSVSSLYTSRRLSSAALPRMTKEPNVSQNKKEHKKNRLRFKTKQNKAKKKRNKNVPISMAVSLVSLGLLSENNKTEHKKPVDNIF